MEKTGFSPGPPPYDLEYDLFAQPHSPKASFRIQKLETRLAFRATGP